MDKLFRIALHEISSGTDLNFLTKLLRDFLMMKQNFFLRREYICKPAVLDVLRRYRDSLAKKKKEKINDSSKKKREDAKTYQRKVDVVAM